MAIQWHYEREKESHTENQISTLPDTAVGHRMVHTPTSLPETTLMSFLIRRCQHLVDNVRTLHVQARITGSRLVMQVSV
ncbi:hypothetical protein BAUCODRAFT_30162 [Baudoinia panamericana UAMH 10762]|uniref:Uncharacterized protein n=1 Tax=Baudoinia panamericana (strain UAMH 10762) TaxID=717646 RepID=M2LYG9_BAUPA|nr:uncharacterized protein BAUCODRAFT_30162 [Baudoinia panamericana UAMH 10762]EMC99757.1 hypothetical protein BAUCODRAFT_30162 [Baudoinia panamericana UAMH 10762]